MLSKLVPTQCTSSPTINILSVLLLWYMVLLALRHKHLITQDVAKDDGRVVQVLHNHTESVHTTSLIVDDSYTHNIPAFVRNASPFSCKVQFDTRPYDKLSKKDVVPIVESFHGVVLSAGPGSVENVDDVGDFVPALLFHRPPIPIFGICLGFQAICKAFGGTIHRLPSPHHGLVSEILDLEHTTLGRCATRYNSLEARLNESSEEFLQPMAVARDFYDPDSFSLMEVRHRELPFWGVQYHPESIFSDDCEDVVLEFLYAAATYQTFRPSDNLDQRSVCNGVHSFDESRGDAAGYIKSSNDDESAAIQEVSWESFDVAVDFFSLIINSMHSEREDLLMLDSRGGNGEWSIFINIPTASVFRYSIRTKSYTWGPAVNDGKPPHAREASLDEAWDFLKTFSASQKCHNGPACVPFWGGFIGYFSYEVGLTELELEAYPQQHERSQPGFSASTPDYDDIHLFWSTETIIHHRPTQTVYTISLTSNHTWLDRMRAAMESSSPGSETTADLPLTESVLIDHPDKEEYLRQIGEAKEQIRAGNSYEICLTAQTRVHPRMNKQHLNDTEAASVDSGTSSLLRLFSKLRSASPAAFMSFMRLGSTAFLSASPELFLAFDSRNRTATMKPIKGTVGKYDKDGSFISYLDAQKILSGPKVIAENLMIVDLIRNDLARVSEEVHCPKLMQVEEIETMYQLVSTVKARVHPETTAWDLLRSSLPPGSMTGAPKRRSCQILQELEHRHPRGLYSGVVGYIDVRGNCQTSVSIRNATKYSNEAFWRIGAGGAIVNLSDALDEWHEGELKARSVARAFQPDLKVLETMLWEPDTGLRRCEEHVGRMVNSLLHFGFRVPFADHDEQGNNDPSSRETGCARARALSEWVRFQLDGQEVTQHLRLSLTIDANGNRELRKTPIGDNRQGGFRPVRVFLDPCSINVAALDEFVRHKTTFRDHYDSARARAGAQGRDEVLLFRPGKKKNNNNNNKEKRKTYGRSQNLYHEGNEDDQLTEGSYTNVAVHDAATQNWVTPSSGCLEGLERERMIAKGEISVADDDDDEGIKRSMLKEGMEVLLFNSVRGCFRGVVASPSSSSSTSSPGTPGEKTSSSDGATGRACGVRHGEACN